MKIKLIDDIPVEKRHGMVKGKVLEVESEIPLGSYWVIGDAGEKVKVFRHEFEVVE